MFLNSILSDGEQAYSEGVIAEVNGPLRITR